MKYTEKSHGTPNIYNFYAFMHQFKIFTLNSENKNFKKGIQKYISDLDLPELFGKQYTYFITH